MDRTTMFERNLTLSTELARAIIDDPVLLEEIPEGATLILLPDDDPDVTQANLELGWIALKRGEDVYFRHVHHAAHAMPAR